MSIYLWAVIVLVVLVMLIDFISGAPERRRQKQADQASNEVLNEIKDLVSRIYELRQELLPDYAEYLPVHFREHESGLPYFTKLQRLAGPPWRRNLKSYWYLTSMPLWAGEDPDGNVIAFIGFNDYDRPTGTHQIPSYVKLAEIELRTMPERIVLRDRLNGIVDALERCKRLDLADNDFMLE